MAKEVYTDAGRVRRLAELAAALVGTQTADEVAWVLADQVQSALDCQYFSLRAIDRAARVARAMEVGGLTVGYRDRFFEVALDLPSAVAEVAATQRAVFVASAADNRRRWGAEGVERYEAAHIEAMARLPLLVEEELIAILSVGYWTPREFDPDERRFLTTVADIAAQALGRALRTERLDRELERARRLGGLAAALAGADTPAEVGNVLVDHVHRAVDADAFALRTIDRAAGTARAMRMHGVDAD